MPTDSFTANYSLPDDATIAAALGLKDLHLGRHDLRDEQDSLVGSLWLTSFWRLRIEPSFGHYGLIGVITARGRESRKDGRSFAWIKAVLSSNGVLFVQDIEVDPLPDVVVSLPLIWKSDSVCCDGVGYAFYVETNFIEEFLRFSNPERPELIAVEHRCWQLAETVALESRNETLIAFTKAWRRYHAVRAN
jgi:hypothetical protein